MVDQKAVHWVGATAVDSAGWKGETRVAWKVDWKVDHLAVL